MTQQFNFPIITTIGNVANPSRPQDVATKGYVDSLAPEPVTWLAVLTATAGQTVFTNVAFANLPTNNAVVVRSGVVLTPVTDYSISGSTLTLTTGASVGDVVKVFSATGGGGGVSTAYDFGTFASPVDFTLDLGAF